MIERDLSRFRMISNTAARALISGDLDAVKLGRKPVQLSIFDLMIIKYSKRGYWEQLQVN